MTIAAFSERCIIRTAGAEGTAILQCDNAYERGLQLIDLACQAPPFAHNKDDYYPGLRKAAPQAYQQWVLNVAAPLLRQHYAMPDSRQAEILLCAYSIVTTPEKRLRPIQCIPHIDSHDANQFAVVHYLCSPPFGGTSFYRHRATRFERIDAARLKAYFAEVKRETMANTTLASGYMNGGNAAFDCIATIPLQFNRMIFYPANLLHSGDIDASQPLSPDPLEGRLTINTFIRFL